MFFGYKELHLNKTRVGRRWLSDIIMCIIMRTLLFLFEFLHLFVSSESQTYRERRRFLFFLFFLHALQPLDFKEFFFFFTQKPYLASDFILFFMLLYSVGFFILLWLGLACFLCLPFEKIVCFFLFFLDQMEFPGRRWLAYTENHVEIVVLSV